MDCHNLGYPTSQVTRIIITGNCVRTLFKDKIHPLGDFVLNYSKNIDFFCKKFFFLICNNPSVKVLNLRHHYSGYILFLKVEKIL